MTPWNDWKPDGVAESISGTPYRHEGDSRLSDVDETAQRSFDTVLGHWEHQGVRTLGLKEVDALKEELIRITKVAEPQR